MSGIFIFLDLKMHDIFLIYDLWELKSEVMKGTQHYWFINAIWKSSYGLCRCFIETIIIEKIINKSKAYSVATMKLSHCLIIFILEEKGIKEWCVTAWKTIENLENEVIYVNFFFLIFYVNFLCQFCS